MGAQRRTTRLYLDADLNANVVRLAPREAHYLGRVLRLKRGDHVLAFNGRGQECEAQVSSVTRREATLTVLRAVEPLPEPRLDLILIQALVKAEPMDFIVQKATEMGVSAIRPVETDFSVVRLGAERIERRVAHWTRKAQSACEQCGRHRPPHIDPPSSLAERLRNLPTDHLKLVLDPQAPVLIHSLEAKPRGVCLLCGPEGGLSAADLALVDAAGFTRCSLGPRMLRAETASLVGCALVQARWGDMR